MPLSVPDSGEPVIGAWALPSTLAQRSPDFPPSRLIGTAVTRSAWPSDSHSSIGQILGQTVLVSLPDAIKKKQKKMAESFRPFAWSHLDCPAGFSSGIASGRNCCRGLFDARCGPVAADGWGGTSGNLGKGPAPPWPPPARPWISSMSRSAGGKLGLVRRLA